MTLIETQRLLFRPLTLEKEYGFANAPFPRLISIIAPDNRASVRVAEKNGMQQVKNIEFEGHICCFYSVDRDQ